MTVSSDIESRVDNDASQSEARLTLEISKTRGFIPHIGRRSMATLLAQNLLILMLVLLLFSQCFDSGESGWVAQTIRRFEAAKEKLNSLPSDLFVTTTDDKEYGFVKLSDSLKTFQVSGSDEELMSTTSRAKLRKRLIYNGIIRAFLKGKAPYVMHLQIIIDGAIFPLYRGKFHDNSGNCISRLVFALERIKGSWNVIPITIQRFFYCDLKSEYIDLPLSFEFLSSTDSYLQLSLNPISFQNDETTLSSVSLCLLTSILMFFGSCLLTCFEFRKPTSYHTISTFT